MNTEQLQHRTTVNIQEKANLIWAIADKLVGTYKPHEADRVIVETIYDKLQEAASKALKKQANNTDANMFAQNIFPKEFDKIAQSCYMESMDAFAKLFEDEQFYKRVMGEMAKAMYLNYRNGAMTLDFHPTKPYAEVNESETPSLIVAESEKKE